METDHDNGSLRVASFSYYLDTARENNIAHRISAQDRTPIPLTSAKKTNSPTLNPPPFSIKFSKPKEGPGSLSKSPRLDSFSYFNNSSDHNLVFEVPGPVHDPTSAFSFSREIPKDRDQISVFSADRYFNMNLTEVKHEFKNKGPGVGLNIGQRTPSLCSEGSSWNSQTGLLPHLQMQTKQKKAVGRNFLTGFGCRGPCFDRKSVHINEIVASYASNRSRAGSERTDRRAILAPVSDPGTEILPVMINNQLLRVEQLDEARHSIDVFGSATSLKRDNIAANMERKLSMLTWDAIPRSGQNLSTSSTTICDDMASDASSDLFEIEKASGSMYTVLKSQQEDDVSVISHYAPSEASIQWSVVTASAADYSALSDYNDEMNVSVSGDMIVSRSYNVADRSSETRREGVKEGQKNRAGGLLGCKSSKAVEVAENVCCRSNEKTKNQGLDLSVSFGKSQASRGRVNDLAIHN
ncbi:protein PHYTOCHROME KINASE SUBSTRATE 3 [Sesamum indicum]|uniref:Protein PHYTOCHROME KINASE SUBSTRATE 3 n=1 Tax=Sesamum indicum TaxID=4182 RepID=A0A6I9TUD3_SESIN|nr:protein PHYTOCHROME KINASE SUBSTRATE 3 [Sesamum indicum]